MSGESSRRVLLVLTMPDLDDLMAAVVSGNLPEVWSLLDAPGASPAIFEGQEGRVLWMACTHAGPHSNLEREGIVNALLPGQQKGTKGKGKGGWRTVTLHPHPSAPPRHPSFTRTLTRTLTLAENPRVRQFVTLLGAPPWQYSVADTPLFDRSSSLTSRGHPARGGCVLARPRSV